jgi:hypothetical protein
MRVRHTPTPVACTPRSCRFSDASTAAAASLARTVRTRRRQHRRRTYDHAHHLRERTRQLPLASLLPRRRARRQLREQVVG